MRAEARPTRAALADGAAIGISMMIAVQIIMPINDAMAKYLVASLPVLQIAWARFLGNAVLLVPVVLWRRGPIAFRVARPGLQVLRSVAILAANLLFVTGVRVVPLAEALSLIFIAPLAVTALAPWLLGERVGTAEWIAVGLGFAGALVIIRPGGSGVDIAALLPLAAGLCFSLYLIITRKLAGSSPADVTLSITSIVAGAALSLIMPFVWVWPTPGQALLLLAIGTATCTGHLLLTRAHDFAPAASLAPFTYLSLVTATALGWSVFGDFPDGGTWLGASIVVLSGLVLWHFRQRGGAAAPSAKGDTIMTPAEFRKSLADPTPPQALAGPVQALWFAAKGDWRRAHSIVQKDEADPTHAWVHAHLHREEGDLANAAYWYRRAGRPVAEGEIDRERREILAVLLGTPD